MPAMTPAQRVQNAVTGPSFSAGQKGRDQISLARNNTADSFLNQTLDASQSLTVNTLADLVIAQLIADAEGMRTDLREQAKEEFGDVSSVRVDLTAVKTTVAQFFSDLVELKDGSDVDRVVDAIVRSRTSLNSVLTGTVSELGVSDIASISRSKSVTTFAPVRPCAAADLDSRPLTPVTPSARAS